MDCIEQTDLSQSRPKSYSESVPPPVVPRKDTRGLALRRYRSSNVEKNNQQSRRTVSTKQPYESEFDKVNNLLRHSLNAKSRTHGGNNQQNTNPETRSSGRPRSHTKFLVEPVHSQNDDGYEDIYLSNAEIASTPTSNMRSISPLLTANPTNFNFPSETLSQSPPRYGATLQKAQNLQVETAIYGVAQGMGVNLVMELKEVQKAANKLYNTLINTKTSSAEMADLRLHLRSGDNAPTNDVLQLIHESLQPPQPQNIIEDVENEIYLIDFQNCQDKTQLRDKLLQLFTMPGPPSIAYQKVTAKLDGLVHTFTETVLKMRIVKNETISSPYHAQSVLQQTGQEADQLIKVLQNNELWIRWGTETGLPPLHHIYMMKHPPSYEMRKSVVMSMISEKNSAIKKVFTEQTRLESLIPPIYSKLDTEKDAWQVTEFDPETQKFESRETKFPLWITEYTKLAATLQSTHRSKFKLGDHIYALYSVYMIIIKDITMMEGDLSREHRNPNSHQIYIGSSSTGVLYRFLNVDRSHCDNMGDILEKSSAMESCRCRHEYELVEACLALAWVRRQPQAVFVINSFQEGVMANMSLNKKKPFHDKMSNLEQHYIDSKKIGPTNDMRFGMNHLGEKNSP